MLLSKTSSSSAILEAKRFKLTHYVFVLDGGLALEDFFLDTQVGFSNSFLSSQQYWPVLVV